MFRRKTLTIETNMEKRKRILTKEAQAELDDMMTDLEFNQWVERVTNKEQGELTKKYNL